MKSFLLAVAMATLGFQEQVPRALDLLEDSGHQYEKAGNGWAVKFNGNNIKEIRVIVVPAGELIVLGAVLATKPEITDHAGLQEALLRANDDYDYVKTTIDNDGDYSIRIDLLAARTEWQAARRSAGPDCDGYGLAEASR